jgi:putative oxidoreductase
MQQVQGIVTIIGRVLLCAIFLSDALFDKIPHFHDTAKMMASHEIPFPPVALAGAIALLVAGSLSIISGYRARLGAALLLIFLAAVTYYFHDFWTIADPKLREMQMIQFMKNLAMMGAMLMIVANGAGPMSIVSFQHRN